MSTELLLNPKTRQAIVTILRDTPHATLIVGSSGAGKMIARHIAKQALGTPVLLEASANYTEIVAEKSITIEQIRLLTKFMQLKVPGTAKIRRVAVVVGADTMTTEAQNALLKLLEEPPADTMLLLTAEQVYGLLPTIRSRAQVLQVIQPSLGQAVEYFQAVGNTKSDIDRAYSISGGQPGLLAALLDGGQDHELARHIAQAKELLQMSSFDRLTQVEPLTKSKDDLPGLLAACKRIAQSALQQAASKHNDAQLQAWHRRLQHIMDAEKALSLSGSPKLVLTDLFLAL